VPTIQIVDGFGLDLQAALNPNSAFSKYFQQLPSLSVIQQNLASLQDVSLVAFPLKSTQIGIAFNQPTAITKTSPQFAGGAAISGTLLVVTTGKLFDPDPFENPIEVPSGHAYMGLGLQVSISPGIKLPSGDVVYGFAVGSQVCFTHYKCFETTTTTPTFRAALEASLQDYVIPLGADDLDALDVGDIATVQGTGSLQFSGTVNLLTSVNPLASLSSPALPGIQVTAGAAIDIGASYTIEGDFQVRIQKVDDSTVRIGFYRKRGSDFTVQVSPSIGVSAGTTNVDFISTVLKAISPSPLPSADQFEEEGLTKDKQETIAKALNAAVQRQLELAVEADLQALSSDEAAFLYEISLRDLGPDGRAAIQDALRLNLSTLLGPEGSLPRGISEIESLLTTTRTRGHSFKVNILGIYNYASINDLTLKGTTLTDPVSGTVLMTDEANATRVTGAVNYLADPDKLRNLLAQSFLITAAYRCSGLIAHAPSLKASYWHFAMHAKTNRNAMSAYLDALQALGLISEAQKAVRLSDLSDFGRSTFYLSTDYDDSLCQSLYLRPDDQPRKIEEYEQIGRQALRQLLHPGDEDGYRLRSLENDALWQQVKATGGTLANLAPLFPDLQPDTQLPIVAGDYLLIEWWATTMSRLAVTLSAAKHFFAQKPAPASNSPAFQKAQADLWHRMADVASKTHDRFADPWGVVAMDLASGQRSMASAQIISAGLTLRVSRIDSSG
jgi:hypothetical protein